MSDNYYCREFVEKLSFPRLPGTEGEKKAQELIETELKKLNIKDYEKESFIYTTFFMNFLLRIYNPFIGFMMIFLIFLVYIQGSFLIMIFGILLLILSFYGRQIREKIEFNLTKIGKKRNSHNYIVEIPAKNKENNQNIIFFAHYDSISHQLHPLFAGAIYLFALIGGTIFSIHVIMITMLYVFTFISSIEIFQFIYGFFLAAFYCIQLFNKRHNKSFGTADNATAVANGFSNIDYFSKNQLENTNLTIVLTGAEEMGDCGANAYIKTHHEEFDKKNTYFFIVDGVGANEKTNSYAFGQGILPKKYFSPVIEKNIKLLLENKKDYYKIKPFYIPPLIHFSTDHAPLKSFHFQYMIFISNSRIHSEKDNIEALVPEMLKNFNEFSRDLIIQMDANFIKKKII